MTPKGPRVPPRAVARSGSRVPSPVGRSPEARRTRFARQRRSAGVVRVLRRGARLRGAAEPRRAGRDGVVSRDANIGTRRLVARSRLGRRIVQSLPPDDRAETWVRYYAEACALVAETDE